MRIGWLEFGFLGLRDGNGRVASEGLLNVCDAGSKHFAHLLNRSQGCCDGRLEVADGLFQALVDEGDYSCWYALFKDGGSMLGL